MREHSSASIDIELCFRPKGCKFQAHPRAEKQPIQRPSVRIPNQRKTLPFMKCARPLKTCLSCCFRLDEPIRQGFGTYEDSRHGDNSSADGDKSKDKKEAKNKIVANV
jgi:hypothetical protein